MKKRSEIGTAEKKSSFIFCYKIQSRNRYYLSEIFICKAD